MNKATSEAPAAGDNLEDMLQHVESREELAAFVHRLVDHLRRRPDEWENRDLSSYLEALAVWVEDMDGYYRNRGEAAPDQPTWKTLGQILLAAKVYE